REIARDRQRHADDARFRGRVGSLANLPVEGGDAGRVDDHAPLAVLWRLRNDARRGQPDNVEAAEQVDRDDALELLERKRPLAAVPMPAQLTTICSPPNRSKAA